MTKPAVVVTGSGGFIGRVLVRGLHRTARDVTCVERAAGFDLSVEGWSRGLPERGADIVVHLAQSRHHREFPQGAEDMFRVNLAATFELLEWARTHGVRRFVFASTGTVYAPKRGKLKESDACAPPSMYAATKLAAESLIGSYAGFFEVVIVRPFAVYGPGQRGMLICDMIDRVRTGSPITLAGGVGIYLTPLFVEDCANVFQCLASTPLAGGVTLINAAGDEIVGLDAIVGAIAARLGKAAVTTVPAGEPSSLCGDNGLLRTYYREDFTPLGQGLASTMENTVE